MNRYLVLQAAALAALLAACGTPTPTPVQSQAPTTPVGVKALGLVEITFDGVTGKASVKTSRLGSSIVGALAAVNDSAASFTAPSTFSVPRSATDSYISGTFGVKANQAFQNLTLYALNQTGTTSNPGGTAMKNIAAFDGTPLNTDDAANRIRPANGVDEVSFAVDPARADLQAFSPVEAASVQAALPNLTPALTGTVLEYGYVARSSAQNGRSFAVNDVGQVTIAVRVPRISDSQDPYRFTITLVLADDSFRRFSRSNEDTTAGVLARANPAATATQVALLGSPIEADSVVTTPGFSLLRLPRLKTSTVPAFYPPNLVISQVYGGGGNGGATYQNDFIEVFNRGNTPVPLTGLSLQYASAAGTSWSNLTPLSGTLAPGRYFLVSGGSGNTCTGTPNGVGAALPTPDIVGGTGTCINLSGTAGKIALVAKTTAMSCNGPTDCQDAAKVLDFVGYGTTASIFEGSGRAPAPSNTTADLRGDGGCLDTNGGVNSTNFTAVTPTPRNSVSPAATLTANCTTP